MDATTCAMLARSLRYIAEVAKLVEPHFVPKVPGEQSGQLLPIMNGSQRRLMDDLRDAIEDANDTIAAYERERATAGDGEVAESIEI